MKANKNNWLFTSIIIGFTCFLIMSFIIIQQQKPSKPWAVPDKYKNMKNTSKKDAASISDGKILYNKECLSCHGKNGKGDGIKAKTLKTISGDFTTATFQSQTDGAIYYKSFIGRDEMPNYEKKITNELDRWAVINYIRSLKK
jgi:mono/diheme cytochrome c family protein